MIHLQTGVPNWLEAVDRLPAGSLVKSVDGVQALAEAKAHNPAVRTLLRHHYDAGQVFGGSLEENKARARAFFSSFVDGTFTQYAADVDLIEEFNEYNEVGHDAQKIAERVTWVTAAAQVWQQEYRTRPELAHIRLVLGNVAIGNDLPWQYAQVAKAHDCVLGYHAYTLWKNKVRDPGDWQWYSGRWATMDENFLSRGYHCDWVFTEAGPFSSAADGWRSPVCLGGDVALYVEAVRQWIRDVKGTDAYQDGRVLGFALFTTGRTRDENGVEKWLRYYTEQPELNLLADMVRAEWTAVTPPTPPPTPPPPPVPTSAFDIRPPAVRPATITFAATPTNIRATPTLTGEVLIQATAGSRLEYLGDVEGDPYQNVKTWAKVAAAGLLGFLHNPALKFAAPPEPPQPPISTGRQTVTDISRHNTLFDSQARKYIANDFAAMKAQGAVACIHRATLGATGEDPALAVNWSPMLHADLYRGMYHLFITGRGTVAQVANIRRAQGVYGLLDLPWVIDVEPIDSDWIDGDEVKAFLDLFADEFNYEPLVYSARWVADYVDGDKSWFATHRLLLADYLSQPPAVGYVPLLPPGATAGQVIGHQWTASHYDGREWGVASSGLDVSVFYEIEKLLL